MSTPFVPGNRVLEERATGKPADFDVVDTASDDVALIAFTSGTTGDPKGCIHFHRDLLVVCNTFLRHVIKPQPDDVFTGTPPLAFTFGLGAVALFPLRFGASTVPLEATEPGGDAQGDPHAGHRDAGRRADGGPGLPAPDGLAEVTSLRTCVAAGEPLAAATSDAWFTKIGIRIVHRVAPHLHLGSRGPRAPGLNGTSGPGLRGDGRGRRPAAAVPRPGRSSGSGRTGGLSVPVPTRARPTTSRTGWNLTGDVYLVDEAGYFWFQVRADDMIISSGYNISGLEVEKASLEHAAVAECAVIASPDDARGNVVKALIVLAPGVRPGVELVAELQHHVEARIAPYEYLRKIAFATHCPRRKPARFSASGCASPTRAPRSRQRRSYRVLPHRWCGKYLPVKRAAVAPSEAGRSPVVAL